MARVALIQLPEVVVRRVFYDGQTLNIDCSTDDEQVNRIEVITTRVHVDTPALQSRIPAMGLGYLEPLESIARIEKGTYFPPLDPIEALKFFRRGGGVCVGIPAEGGELLFSIYGSSLILACLVNEASDLNFSNIQ